MDSQPSPCLGAGTPTRRQESICPAGQTPRWEPEGRGRDASTSPGVEGKAGSPSPERKLRKEVCIQMNLIRAQSSKPGMKRESPNNRH